MSNLNYSVGKTFLLLLQQLKTNLFISIILTCIIFGIILYINRNNKMTKYIFIGINIILFGFVLVLYAKSMLKFNYINPLKNINVYFLNIIIYLIICVILNKKIYQKQIYLGLDVLNKMGIIYSIIMTIYLKNITIIVIGNIFPQIFFGNILLIISYGLLLIER